MALYENIRVSTELSGVPYPSSMTLLLCEFNLPKLATLVIYGLAGMFAGIFGSKQSWHEAERWIYTART